MRKPLVDWLGCRPLGGASSLEENLSAGWVHQSKVPIPQFAPQLPVIKPLAFAQLRPFPHTTGDPGSFFQSIHALVDVGQSNLRKISSGIPVQVPNKVTSKKTERSPPSCHGRCVNISPFGPLLEDFPRCFGKCRNRKPYSCLWGFPRSGWFKEENTRQNATDTQNLYGSPPAKRKPLKIWQNDSWVNRFAWWSYTSVQWDELRSSSRQDVFARILSFQKDSTACAKVLTARLHFMAHQWVLIW